MSRLHCAMLTGLVMVVTPATVSAQLPKLETTILHKADAAQNKLVVKDGTYTITATGRESFAGADDGVFAHLATDAPNWSFTARVAKVEADTKTPKFGVSVRNGTERWNRGLLLRYDGYEGNRALQWVFRYNVAHGTHNGWARCSFHGVERDKALREGFWLRVSRQCPTVKAEWSEDGETWRPIAGDRQFNLLPGKVHVGLMVTAGGHGKTPITVTFDNVSFQTFDGAMPQRKIAPEAFADYTPPMPTWEMHLVAADDERDGPDSHSLFVIKPKGTDWKDIRAFYNTSGSKEVLISRGGKIEKLPFESGPVKRRKPADMPKWEGVYELTPQPIYHIFAHYGLARLGTPSKPQKLQQGIEALSEQTGYPLVNVPWVNQGMSAAGGNAARVARQHPERTIAVSPSHIGMAGWDVTEPAVLNTPHLYVLGSRDTGGQHMKQAAQTAQTIRDRGAQWSVAPLWWYYHVIGHTQSLTFPYLFDCLELRLPADADHSQGPVKLKDIPTEDGYLALYDTWESNFPKVVAWKDATQAQREGPNGWLPTARVARLWQAAVSDWPRTTIHFPRFDSTSAWTGSPPGPGHVHHMMAAGEPFHLLASGPTGDDVTVEYFADLEPLKVIKTYGSPYIVQLEGLPVGLHNLYAITTIGGRQEISRPQMIFFAERVNKWDEKPEPPRTPRAPSRSIHEEIRKAGNGTDRIRPSPDFLINSLPLLASSASWRFDSMPEQVLLREHARLFEVGQGLFGGAEDFGGGLGDEGRRVALGFPDDVDLSAVLEGVVQLTLDAAGQARHAVGQLGHQRDDHVGLADHLEVARVDLAVHIPRDVEHLLDRHVQRLLPAGERARFHLDKVLALLGRVDRGVEQQLLIHVGRVEGDEVLGQLRTEGVDLGQRVGQPDDVGHRERRVHRPHLRPKHQAETRLDGVFVSAARQDVEPVADAQRLGQQLGGHDLLFAPDHQVLEGGIDLVVAVQAGVDDLDVVEQADEGVGLQVLHLVEVEGREQPVAPAEGGVGVDDDVFLALRVADDVLERRAAQGVEPGELQVEDLPGLHVRGLVVHHVADVVQADRLPAFAGQPGDLLEVFLLIHADLPGNDRAHVLLLDESRKRVARIICRCGVIDL